MNSIALKILPMNFSEFKHVLGSAVMGATHVDMLEAKSRFSEPGELAHQGEKILIDMAGKPYLVLVAHRESRDKRSP